MDMRQKTNVPDGHGTHATVLPPTPPPVQRNSSDLGDSHKWPWSRLGGGPDPWTPAQRRPCT